MEGRKEEREGKWEEEGEVKGGTAFSSQGGGSQALYKVTQTDTIRRAIHYFQPALLYMH